MNSFEKVSKTFKKKIILSLHPRLKKILISSKLIKEKITLYIQSHLIFLII